MKVGGDRRSFVSGLMLAALLFGFLIGCKPKQQSQANEQLLSRQQVVATAELERLRDLFNHSSCSAMYAHPAFRQQSEEDWIKQCKELRHHLGMWETFTVTSRERAGDEQIILLIGNAVLGGHKYQLATMWDIEEHQGVYLIEISLVNGDERIQIPVSKDRRHLDPLPAFEERRG